MFYVGIGMSWDVSSVFGRLYLNREISIYLNTFSSFWMVALISDNF